MVSQGSHCRHSCLCSLGSRGKDNVMVVSSHPPKASCGHRLGLFQSLLDLGWVIDSCAKMVSGCVITRVIY